MLNPAHLLEIALLLLVAFLFGASIGAVARLVVLRLQPAKVAAQPVVAGAATVEAAPALVTAPVIDPMAKPAAPVAPAEVAAPDFTEALLALAGDKPLPEMRMPSIAPLPTVDVSKPGAVMAPARAAGETTSGRAVAHPQVAAEPSRTDLVSGPGAAVIPFPVDKVVAEPNDQPDMVEPRGEAVEPVDAAEDVAAAALNDEPPPQGELRDAAVIEASPEPASIAEAASLVPSTMSAPEPSAEDDEAAAMRAIEGNWSPRRGTPAKPRRTAPPDDVAADTVAEANVPAFGEPEVAAGKPLGIEAPRLGVKDELTNVIGILPIIETALNRLGLYHFDQVAELSDANVAFIEAHLGIGGRIAREHWREQARELGAAMATRQFAGNP